MKQSKRKREAPAAVVDSITPSVAPPVVSKSVANAAKAAAPLELVAVSASSAAAASATYRLAATCTVRDCASLKTALSELMYAPGEAILDVSAIERVDTAALQLLYAFARDRKAQGGIVTWSGNSECFSEAVNALGLFASMGLPAGMGPQSLGATA
jgi:anti-anti-sigma regulatory factor